LELVFRNTSSRSLKTEILTPLQKELLRVFAQEPLFKDFYLTGETTLSVFYLHHRFSEDLDFFTELPHGVVRIPPVIDKIANSMKLKMVMGRRFETFFECTLANSMGDKVELDFALDLPGRLQPVRWNSGLNLHVDNEVDIGCNKLSALYDRAESKDFVDLYFLNREKIPWEALLENARKKFRYLDDYGLSLSFFKVKGIEKLPRMIKPLQLEALKKFFLDRVAELSDQFSDPQ
jgi:predicted nucleotidyltransferase component of viral defense system